MPGHQHLQELKATYAAYEPYLASISSGTTLSSSCRSLSSLSAAQQEKLHAALQGLDARTPEALLALCAALDVAGRRTDPDDKVQALMVQAWWGLSRVMRSKGRLRFWRREAVCAFPSSSSLETVLGGVTWSVGRDMRGAFLHCVFALYSSDLENSGGVALTSSEFAMLWRSPGGIQLEGGLHWAQWLEGRKVGLIDLLENDDFWNSNPFRSQSEVDRLLAFVDSRHCPFQPARIRRRPAAARPKMDKPAPSPKETSVALVKWGATPRPRENYAAAAHIDKALMKRIMAVLPSDECEAYIERGMPDPRVIAVAFANLSVEVRHWA